jgi:hypothetical protein
MEKTGGFALSPYVPFRDGIVRAVRTEQVKGFADLSPVPSFRSKEEDGHKLADRAEDRAARDVPFAVFLVTANKDRSCHSDQLSHSTGCLRGMIWGTKPTRDATA